MARKKKTREQDWPAVIGETVAEQPAPLPPEPASAFKFNLKAMWVNPIVVVENVADEAAARAELHRLLDQAIQAVERTR
jgi:hypothetical protein